MAHTHTQKKPWQVALLITLLLASPVVQAVETLVNTESYDTIDEGDGTTNIELRFGGVVDERLFWDRNAQRFEFTDDVHVQGNLSVTGSLVTDGAISTKDNLTVNSDGGATNAVITFGNDSGDETIQFNDGTDEFDISDDVNVTGTLDVTDKITTNTGLVINADNGAVDAVLSFGNDAGPETIRFSDTNNRFEFTDDVYAAGDIDATGDITAGGTLSGNTLTVSSGAITINGVEYLFTQTQGTNGQVLTNDGNGNLTWQDSNIGTGSGVSLSLQAEYPNAVYDPDGSNNVGQLQVLYDDSNNVNHYQWTTSRSTLQDYDILVRLRVPNTFSSWLTTDAIELQYRTQDAVTANNSVRLQVFDTTGASDFDSGVQADTSLTTANTTPDAADLNGTYAPGDYMTIQITVAANGSTKYADVGFLNINWLNSAP